ncbi:MAG: hemerythrin family protein [Bacteriovoracaceae bacterium]|nr:hemerythrin family protein [Bacteriovoracaceae bacterium]
MDERAWVRWLLQTSRKWEDIEHIVMETGIAEVDEDHKILAKYAIDLNNAINRIDSDDFGVNNIEEEYKLLKTFQDYAIDHFRREEELIIKHQIDGLEIQQTQHKKILDKVEVTIESFRAGRIMVSLSLKLELLDWIVDHINKIDYSIFSPEHFSSSIESAVGWEDLRIFFRGTGVLSIDQEHTEIIEIFLSFTNSCKMTSPRSEIIIFDQFIESVISHCNHEEEFIEEYKLPNLSTQKKSHKSFIDLILKHRKRIMSDSSIDMVKMKYDIVVWWIRHTSKLDRSSLALENWTEQIFKNTKVLNDISWLIHKTGDDIVDQQHLDVVRIALDLFRYSDEGSTLSDTLQGFCELENAVKKHFVYEEKVLGDSQYQQMEAHKVEHEQILAWLSSIRISIENGSFVFNRGIKIKLLEWWISHTNYIDYKAFSENLPAGGVS